MITFQGVVVREPELLVDSQRIVLETRAVEGHVQVKRPLRPRYQVGDRLEVYCMLRKPEPFDGFAYDKYLERYGIGGLCYFPGARFIEVEESWQRRLFMAKEWVVDRFRHAMAPPEQSLILGALFGNKRAIPNEVMNAFRATGTSHILVISGMHVSLITALLARVISWLRLPRRLSVVTILCMLAVYVLLTGVQSSAVRASLFGSSTLIAQLVGRPKSSLRLLVVVAAGMLLANPLLLWFDTGFQLSFSATAGIIVFNTWFENRLRWLPQAVGIRTTAATSISAIVATTPVSAYAFGTFSPVALAANLVVVPLMPIVMIYAIAAVIVAVALPGVAMWFALPLYYLLRFMVWVVSWFGSLPFASVTLPSVHWSLAVAGCCVLVWWGNRIIQDEQVRSV